MMDQRWLILFGKGSNHYIQIDRPDLVNLEIGAFVGLIRSHRGVSGQSFHGGGVIDARLKVAARVQHQRLVQHRKRVQQPYYWSSGPARLPSMDRRGVQLTPAPALT